MLVCLPSSSVFMKKNKLVVLRMMHKWGFCGSAPTFVFFFVKNHLHAISVKNFKGSF